MTGFASLDPLKRCPDCGVQYERSAANFAPSPAHRGGGLSAYCRKCASARRRTRWESMTEQQRIADRRERYLRERELLQARREQRTEGIDLAHALGYRVAGRRF